MSLIPLALSAAILIGGASTANAAPAVVVSIKPLHSLVASVMEGVAEPDLIVEGAGSPHAYALKPSQAQAIENADIVFWTGHLLEAFLENPLESLAANANVIELSDVPGLTLLQTREGGAFEAHLHDDDEDHTAGDHEEEEGHDEIDTHLWLDPQNARSMLPAIEAALSSADPANAETYRANAEKTATRLADLEISIAKTLAPVKGKPFIVFHDAFQYFENRFGLAAAGSITVSPEVAPGAERIAEMRHKLAETTAVCVFSEPQFAPKIVSVVIEGSSAKAGTLDPLGATLPPGPDLYFDVLTDLAASFRDCVGD